jgi:hypothetical protein
MTIDHLGKFLVGLQALPLERGTPVVEEASGPGFALIAPELAGVPVYVTGTGLRDPNAGEKKNRWVYLEFQYDDAVALLNNPEHKVARPVDVGEFYQRAATEKQKPLLAVPVMVGIIVAVAAFVVLAISVAMRFHGR